MSTATEMITYQSERHREHVRQMLEVAGAEIMRGWHEEADTPAEELDPEMDIQAQGDIDFLDDVMMLAVGETMPSGYASAEEWAWVRSGMQDYVDGLVAS